MKPIYWSAVVGFALGCVYTFSRHGQPWAALVFACVAVLAAYKRGGVL